MQFTSFDDTPSSKVLFTGQCTDAMQARVTCEPMEAREDTYSQVSKNSCNVVTGEWTEVMEARERVLVHR